MKRWQEILVGVLAVICAVALGFVDTGYSPDSMDCGTGMNGRGYCGDGTGFFLVPLLKWCVTIGLGIIGLGLIVGPQSAAAKEGNNK